MTTVCIYRLHYCHFRTLH